MNILLAGDSWGVKPKMPLSNSHNFSQYMGLEDHIKNDGHHVKNISISGISNFDIIKKIEAELKQDNFDLIIFIQTDPLRDQIDCKSNLSFFEIHDEKWFENYQDLLSIKNKLLDNAYEKLNKLSRPIYLIGGCSKVNINMLSKYSNLICIIPSIPELLEPGYSMPDIWGMSKWQQKIDKRWDIETLDKLLEQLSITEWLHNNSFYFKFDAYHPNSEGYKKVYTHFKNILRI